MIGAPPPRFGGNFAGWLALAVALVGPWAWLAVLERIGRRKR